MLLSYHTDLISRPCTLLHRAGLSKVVIGGLAAEATLSARDAIGMKIKGQLASDITSLSPRLSRSREGLGPSHYQHRASYQHTALLYDE
jgi:hypothetical protein